MADAPKQEYPSEVQPLLKTLQSALSSEDDADMAGDVINFLMIQFNPATRRSVIDYVTYKLTLSNCTKGLFRVIFISHYPKKGQNSDTPIDLSKHKAIFYASFNLSMFMFSKILEGKEYDLDLAEINAKKQDIHINRSG